MANTKDYSMREMIIDQCLSTGREFTREELQEAVNKGLQSRDMLPIKSKVTILQDINEMDEKFRRMYGTSGIVFEDRGRKRYYRYRDGIESIYNRELTSDEIEKLRTFKFGCTLGTIQRTISNHPYMRLHVDKWRENGASTREIVLMEFLKKFLI